MSPYGLITGLRTYSGSVTQPFISTRPASHALVYVLHGITVPWKQTVAYYFTSASTPGQLLWQVWQLLVNVRAWSWKNKCLYGNYASSFQFPSLSFLQSLCFCFCFFKCIYWQLLYSMDGQHCWPLGFLATRLCYYWCWIADTCIWVK